MFQIAGGSIGLGLTTTVFSAAIPPFVDGVRAAFRLDAALSLVGLLIAVLFVGGRAFGRRPGAAGRGLSPNRAPRSPSRYCWRMFWPLAPPEQVDAGAADQDVVAAAAEEAVVAGASVQHVVARTCRTAESSPDPP